MSDCERIAQVAHQKLLIHLFLGKNERFTQKKDERIPSPDSVVQYSSSGPPPSLYAMKMAFFHFQFLRPPYLSVCHENGFFKFFSSAILPKTFSICSSVTSLLPAMYIPRKWPFFICLSSYALLNLLLVPQTSVYNKNGRFSFDKPLSNCSSAQFLLTLYQENGLFYLTFLPSHYQIVIQPPSSSLTHSSPKK